MSGLKKMWRGIKFSTQTMWKLDAKFRTMQLLVRITDGLIPSLLLYVEALILTQLSKTSSSNAFVICLCFIAADYVLNILGSGGIWFFYGKYNSYQGTIIGRKLSAIGQKRIMQMDLRCYYDDNFNVESNVTSVGGINTFYESLLNTIQSLTTLASSIILLISIEPLFVMFVLIFSVPSFFASNKIADVREKLKGKISFVSAHAGAMKGLVIKKRGRIKNI